MAETRKKKTNEKKPKAGMAKRKKKVITPRPQKEVPAKKRGIIRTRETRTKKKGILKGRKQRKAVRRKKRELDPYDIIRFPLSTEKGVRLMESENKLLFVVSRKATKNEIKRAIETMFKVKVASVNVLNSMKGQRRAYVKFSFETPAIDIATDLGMI